MVGLAFGVKWIMLTVLLASGSVSGSDLDKAIDYLNDLIAKSQVVNPNSSDIWVEQKGIYPSDIRNNFVGSVTSEILRDNAVVFDNNAFVTLWVSVMLLEATRFQDGPVPEDEQLQLTLDVLKSYHDKNSPEGDGSTVFWPQSYNQSDQLWFANPVNVLRTAKAGDEAFDALHKILDEIGEEKLWNSTFRGMKDLIDYAVDAFHIPADFDDSFVNIGLGAMLSAHHPNQLLFQRWKENNSNFTQVFNKLKKYAYRPFSSDENGIIDSRTYFAMRSYLYSLEERHLPAAFVTTWAHSISEEYRTRFSFVMPFHVNNVDLTVGANTIYGITASVLTKIADPQQWFDEDVQMVYENTTNLIAHMVSSNFSSRPDILLTYYPSVYNFYWFTARTLNLLQSYSEPLPYPVLTRVMNTLATAWQGNVTADLLKRAIVDKDDGLVFFEDFLGNNDRDILGKKVSRGEDRLCSTAMAVNTLLYSWMKGGEFLPSTPSRLKYVVGNASLWLVKNLRKMKAYNVVFSGSVKSAQDYPFYFPANVMKYINGTPFSPDSNVNADVTLGVQSIFPRDEYEAELKKKHFGGLVAPDFQGYNSSPFPFWSSDAFTHASVMLALTQYRALVSTGQLNYYQ